jgi:hypothetical protein
MLSHCMLSHCSLLNCWSPFSMCRQAAPGADGSCSADEHFPATERFNVIWAYAALAHSPPSDFLTLLCCRTLHELPKFSPEDISNSISVVARLKHTNISPCVFSFALLYFKLGCVCSTLHVCASCVCVLPACVGFLHVCASCICVLLACMCFLHEM